MSFRPEGGALLDALESGSVRAAEPTPEGWVVHPWVKEGILELFRTAPVVPQGIEADPEGPAFGAFLDKQAFPTRRFTVEERVRLVPGGSAVRRGAHVGRDVVLMPPCYVNVGAHVVDGAMIDSHALVGSCAQVGARVHLAAGAQLGGVLEPPGARPVIVEDDAFVGANAGLFDGVLIGAGAVIAAGVVLTRGTLVFDLVRERVLRWSEGHPLEIPPRAVVVPGGRSVPGDFGAEHGLSVACALLVKERDERTDAATALEEALR